MRFALAFGLCGASLAALAAGQARQAAGLGWLPVAAEAYLAAGFLSLAALYGLRRAGVVVEDYLRRPGWSHVVRGAVLPYLAAGAAALYLSRRFDREGLLNAVAPGLSIGRLPFPSEREALRRAGVRAVLNLCWEFPRLSGVGREAGIETAFVPILDGSPPTPRQFEEATRRVARWRAEGRCVLVHCAQGHGRSATVVAASLVRLGLAPDADQALAIIRAARPPARPSRAQRAALDRYTSSSREDHG